MSKEEKRIMLRNVFKIAIIGCIASIVIGFAASLVLGFDAAPIIGSGASITATICAFFPVWVKSDEKKDDSKK